MQLKPEEHCWPWMNILIGQKGKFRLPELLSESVNLGNVRKVFESLDILNFQGYSVLLKLQRLQVEIGKLSE